MLFGIGSLTLKATGKSCGILDQTTVHSLPKIRFIDKIKNVTHPIIFVICRDNWIMIYLSIKFLYLKMCYYAKTTIRIKKIQSKLQCVMIC